MSLRPYQSHDSAAILACLARGESPLYALPTGGGKTVVATSVIDTVRQMGWRVLVAVHRRELLRQAARTIRGAGHDVDVLAAREAWVGGKGVIVASIDTVNRRRERLGKLLASVDLTVVDEAHHSVADSWAQTLAAMRAQRLGLSATPWRKDGKGLGDFFGSRVIGPSIRELVDAGWLAEPQVFAPTERGVDTSRLRKRFGDFSQGDIERLVDTDEVTRAAIVWYTRLSPGVPAVAYCASVEHARHVAEAFSGAGWAARSVDGTTPQAERDAAIAGLANGTVQVLCSCDLISEGLDVPGIGSVILLRPTASTGLYMQQVGRGMRPPGPLWVIDVVGNARVHGLPDERRAWTLDGGTRGLEMAVTATRRCPDCTRVSRITDEACPTCGRRFVATLRPPTADLSRLPPVITPEGHRITAERLRAMRMGPLLRLCQTREDLEIAAMARGYKRGWVDHVLADRARWAAARVAL